MIAQSTDLAETPQDPINEDADPIDENALVEELLVEEVSIDGMCGVY